MQGMRSLPRLLALQHLLRTLTHQAGVFAGCGSAFGADDADARVGSKPDLLRALRITAQPLQRCQPGTSGCGQLQSVLKSPWMAKCRPVASLTLSLTHGRARFQSQFASTTNASSSTATTPPTSHRAMRKPRWRAAWGRWTGLEGTEWTVGIGQGTNGSKENL